MNLLDLLLIFAFVGAVAGGLHVGFVARAATWLGLGLGVALATWTVPTALGLMPNGAAGMRLFAGLLILILTVTVVTSLFQIVGLRARRSIAATPLSGLDHAAGAVAGGALVIALVWVLVPAAANVPGSVSHQVRSSLVVATVQDVTPPAPDAVRALRNLVDSSRFPDVFADLRPAPETGPPPDQIPVDSDIVDRATRSTVNVEARGCGRHYEGSGFAIDVDTVVTNAHVVAGADDVEVKRPDGAVRSATVVVFDPDRDLAVLEVADLDQEPLATAPASVGEPAVTIGYPGGQDEPRVAPARIDDRRSALGRDIYGRSATEREVLFLAAQLRQGDSGSPVIDTAGRVVGVVFAISPDRATTAYALDLVELEAALSADRDPGMTGACI